MPPAELLELVEHFRRNLDDYRKSSYKEERVRVEFVNPFFELLGWDVYNKRRRSERYKEVVHEASQKVGGATRAPDYLFCLTGKPVFYVEAKKPAVDLKHAVNPAFQLRRYVFSRKDVLAGVLTDFEELAVYGRQHRPHKNDKARVDRKLYCGFEEYHERWDEIASVLSREAVERGELDRFVGAGKKTRGTEEVDDEFLEDIEKWRKLLANDVAKRNRRLSQRELNFAVQRTIDRIIFLRIAEDRGIERWGRLLGETNGRGVYKKLFGVFRAADEFYNSGLFHFEGEKGRATDPDELTPALKVDDGIVRRIITELYPPESPYAFDVLPPEILGQVYERFLGNVIRRTAGGAKVEQKPEVRKAGGVYYTPQYIVDYIVKNTVGKLLEKAKTPARAAKLKVLDPACGSGSFLLGAYQHLLDWHLDYYSKDTAKWTKGKKGRIYEGPPGEWHLTLDERKRILLDNIHGVDLDEQAVEVTKLSLLLKVLESVPGTVLHQYSLMEKKRALPDLGKNIICGNSLIGSDYFDGRLDVTDEERERVNAFDWEGPEGFLDIFKGKNPGFDAVIGNPPWGASFADAEKSYFRTHYKLNTGKFESYIFFIEKAAALLNKNGFFGFIVPSYWISRSQTEALRDHLCGTLWPNTLVVLPENVFTGVKMDSCVVVASRAKSKAVNVCEIAKGELPDASSADALSHMCTAVSVLSWKQRPRLRFNPRVASADVPVLARIEKGAVSLADFVDITQGLTLYRRSTLTEQFGSRKAEEIVSKRLFHSDHKKNKTFKKELLGRDVSRYRVEWNGRSWVSYGPWLAHAVNERFFRGPRLVVQKIRNPMLTQRLVVGYLVDNETYSAGVLLNAVLKTSQQYQLLYLMALLNSKALNYWYRKCILDVSVRVVDLAQVPIAAIDFSAPADKAKHDRMVSLVRRMLDLNKKLPKAKTPHAKNLIDRDIAATDRRIDQLVYELYGLTEKEIRIVEGAAGNPRR